MAKNSGRSVGSEPGTPSPNLDMLLTLGAVSPDRLVAVGILSPEKADHWKRYLDALVRFRKRFPAGCGNSLQMDIERFLRELEYVKWPPPPPPPIDPDIDVDQARRILAHAKEQVDRVQHHGAWAANDPSNLPVPSLPALEDIQNTLTAAAGDVGAAIRILRRPPARPEPRPGPPPEEMLERARQQARGWVEHLPEESSSRATVYRDDVGILLGPDDRDNMELGRAVVQFNDVTASFLTEFTYRGEIHDELRRLKEAASDLLVVLRHVDGIFDRLRRQYEVPA